MQHDELDYEDIVEEVEKGRKARKTCHLNVVLPQSCITDVRKDRELLDPVNQ